MQTYKDGDDDVWTFSVMSVKGKPNKERKRKSHSHIVYMKEIEKKTETKRKTFLYFAGTFNVVYVKAKTQGTTS